MNKEALIKDLEALRDSMRQNGEGSGEGDYFADDFADELNSVIQKHTAKTINIGDLVVPYPKQDMEFRIHNLEVIAVPSTDMGPTDFTLVITAHRV